MKHCRKCKSPLTKLASFGNLPTFNYCAAVFPEGLAREFLKAAVLLVMGIAVAVVYLR